MKSFPNNKCCDHRIDQDGASPDVLPKSLPLIKYFLSHAVRIGLEIMVEIPLLLVIG